MTNSTQAQSGSASTDAIAMRSEIATKWNKLNESEIAALKANDDLVSLVQSKYTMDKSQAQKDVEAFAKGRKL